MRDRSGRDPRCQREARARGARPPGSHQRVRARGGASRAAATGRRTGRGATAAASGRAAAGPSGSRPADERFGRSDRPGRPLETEKWPAEENDKAIHDQSKASATMRRGGGGRGSDRRDLCRNCPPRASHDAFGALAAAKDAMLVKGVASESHCPTSSSQPTGSSAVEEEIFAAARQTRTMRMRPQVGAAQESQAPAGGFQREQGDSRLASEKQVLDHIRAMRCPGAAPAVRGSGVSNGDNDNNGKTAAVAVAATAAIQSTTRTTTTRRKRASCYDVGKRASCSFLTAGLQNSRR